MAIWEINKKVLDKTIISNVKSVKKETKISGKR